MTTALLTGGTGFAGSHFLDWALEKTDWNLIVIRGARVRAAPSRIAHLTGNPRVRFIAKDLTRPFTDAEAVALGPVDSMICYASQADPAESVASPAAFIGANVAIALSTLELARMLQPRRLAWVSTAEAVGPLPFRNAPAYCEGAPHRPRSPYAASKAAQEDIVRSYAFTYDVPAVVVRAQNLLGERQDPAKLVPSVVRKVLAAEPVTVYCDGDGYPGSRVFLHARGLAEGTGFLLSRKTVHAVPEDCSLVQHVVGDRRRSVLDVAQLIADALGRPLAYELVPAGESRPGHEPGYALNGAQLPFDGWRPSMTFEESLRQTVTWYQEHPEWLGTGLSALGVKGLLHVGRGGAGLGLARHGLVRQVW